MRVVEVADFPFARCQTALQRTLGTHVVRSILTTSRVFDETTRWGVSMPNCDDDRKLALVRLCRMGGRVCPNSQKWVEFWKLIGGRSDSTDIPKYLILGGWGASNWHKRECFEQQLAIGFDNGMLDQVERFLTSLREDDWHTCIPYHAAPRYALPDPGVDTEPQWVCRLLHRAIVEGWCLKMNCADCGSIDLRGALGLLDHALPLQVRSMSTEKAEAIVDGLRACSPNAASSSQMEEAARWVLYEVWCNSGDPYFSKLDGSWAGDVLAGMQAHYQQRQLASRLHDARQGVRMRDWRE